MLAITLLAVRLHWNRLRKCLHAKQCKKYYILGLIFGKPHIFELLSVRPQCSLSPTSSKFTDIFGKMYDVVFIVFGLKLLVVSLPVLLPSKDDVSRWLFISPSDKVSISVALLVASCFLYSLNVFRRCFSSLHHLHGLVCHRQRHTHKHHAGRQLLASEVRHHNWNIFRLITSRLRPASQPASSVAKAAKAPWLLGGVNHRALFDFCPRYETVTATIKCLALSTPPGEGKKRGSQRGEKWSWGGAEEVREQRRDAPREARIILEEEKIIRTKRWKRRRTKG